MPKTIAYMVTWTTYGTWLQGDKRRYVKDGQTLPENEPLADSNKEALAKEPVRFNRQHRRIVEDAIRQKAIQSGQQIYALVVCYNHLHIVAGYIPKPIDFVVQHYKAAGLIALRKVGINGKIWTKGFNTRYCFEQQTLQRKIDYVTGHPNNI
jgi:hypothetical protein